MTLQDRLQQNKKDGTALLATNFYNFETLTAVLGAAKKANQDIILQLSESSLNYMGVKTGASLAKTVTEQFGVKAWLHMDHGSDINLVKECLHAGFDSVMIDASEQSFADNIRITKEIVKYAEGFKANVEAELGYVAKLGQEQSMVYTQPDEAKTFVEETGIDALAIAVGTAHGFYSKTPELQLDLIKSINEATSAALVLHGSSGVPDNQLQEAVLRGITKINLATEIKNAFMKRLQEVLQNSDEIDLRKVFPVATKAAEDLVYNKLLVINSKDLIVA